MSNDIGLDFVPDQADQRFQLTLCMNLNTFFLVMRCLLCCLLFVALFPSMSYASSAALDIGNVEGISGCLFSNTSGEPWLKYEIEKASKEHKKYFYFSCRLLPYLKMRSCRLTFFLDELGKREVADYKNILSDFKSASSMKTDGMRITLVQKGKPIVVFEGDNFKFNKDHLIEVSGDVIFQKGAEQQTHERLLLNVSADAISISNPAGKYVYRFMVN